MNKLTTLNRRTTRPSFSPDGEQIAFTSGKGPIGAGSDVYIMDANGSNLQKLPPFGMNNFGAIFDPTGKYIAYASDSVGEGLISDAQIDVIDKSGKHIKRLKHPGTDHVFSPNGQFIAFSTGNKLYLESVLDQDLLCLATAVNTTGLRTPLPRIRQPSFHPDGERLCYTSSQDRPGRNEVYAIQRDGTKCTRISFLTTGADNPIFSQTVEVMYFISSAFSSGWPKQIFKVDQYKLDVEPLVNSKSIYGDLTSSLDGRWLLYTSYPNDDQRATSLDISLLNVSSGQAYKIVRDGYYNRFASFSPDSKSIVYCSCREKITEIYRLDIMHLMS